MAYRIELTKSAVKELERLSAKTHDRIIQHLAELEQNPRIPGAEKLTGIDAYKLRVGNYRIVYEINDAEKTVRVVMVEDRKTGLSTASQKEVDFPAVQLYSRSFSTACLAPRVDYKYGDAFRRSTVTIPVPECPGTRQGQVGTNAAAV